MRAGTELIDAERTGELRGKGVAASLVEVHHRRAAATVHAAGVERSRHTAGAEVERTLAPVVVGENQRAAELDHATASEIQHPGAGFADVEVAADGPTPAANRRRPARTAVVVSSVAVAVRDTAPSHVQHPGAGLPDGEIAGVGPTPAADRRRPARTAEQAKVAGGVGDTAPAPVTFNTPVPGKADDETAAIGPGPAADRCRPGGTNHEANDAYVAGDTAPRHVQHPGAGFADVEIPLLMVQLPLPTVAVPLEPLL